MQLRVNKCSILILPIAGFGLQSSGVGSNCSANWATTTAQRYLLFVDQTILFHITVMAQNIFKNNN